MRKRAAATVLGAMLGIACGATVVVPYTFGYFVDSWSAAFGWSRAAISPAITIYMVLLIAALPLAGAIVDRLGPRRAAAFSVAAIGVLLLALSRLSGSIGWLYAAYAALALLGAAASPVAYARAVVLWFDHHRGLALGIALSGVGLGTALLPMLVRAFAADGDWRAALVALGALMLMVILPAVLVLLPRDGGTTINADRMHAEHGDGPALHTATPGLTLRAAMRESRFWRLAASFLLLGLAMSGVVVYLPPVLAGRGLDGDVAARVQLYIGVSAIVGRLVGGWLMDRIHAPMVSAGAAAAAAAGLLLLGHVDGWGSAAIALGICLGLATGVEGDVLAYLSSRYFGMHAFSAILAWQVGAYLVGAALGPLALGAGAQLLGDYEGVLAGFAIALGIAAALQLTLGRYAYSSGVSVK